MSAAAAAAAVVVAAAEAVAAATAAAAKAVEPAVLHDHYYLSLFGLKPAITSRRGRQHDIHRHQTYRPAAATRVIHHIAVNTGQHQGIHTAGLSTPIIRLITVRLALHAKLVAGELRNLLPAKRIAVHAGQKLRVGGALFEQILIAAQLLAGLVPGAVLLDLEGVDVGGDGLHLVAVNGGPLVVAPEEAHLNRRLQLVVTHHLTE